jgi:branched-chain amino acid transport system substrate-binding protein
MKRLLLAIICVMVLVALPLLVSCSSPSATSNVPAAPASSAPAAAPATSSQAAAPSASKTLKIGVVVFMGWPVGLDMYHGMDLLTEMANKKGGVNVGGENYKVQIIQYDTNMAQATEVSAVNRLIYEDKVDYIIGGDFVNAWLPVTEKEKIVSLVSDPEWRFYLAPNLHYAFNPDFKNCVPSVNIAWYAKKYPDKAKSVVMLYPDSQQGKLAAESDQGWWAAAGVTNTTIMSFPTSMQDFSSLATKVRTMNPTTVSLSGGGPATEGLVWESIYKSGYRGQFFGIHGGTLTTLGQTMSAEGLNGFISNGDPVEFDPPLTNSAKEFVAAWKAKYGNWEGQASVGDFNCLLAAFEKAGTTDPEKVAAVIGSGLRFECPSGTVQMVSRPDLGNDRTVDSVVTMYEKSITNGKLTLLDTIDPDTVATLFKNAQTPAK